MASRLLTFAFFSLSIVACAEESAPASASEEEVGGGGGGGGRPGLRPNALDQ